MLIGLEVVALKSVRDDLIQAGASVGAAACARSAATGRRVMTGTGITGACSGCGVERC
jgi:hypothetical protein